MSAGADYAHSGEANLNRHRKALALRTAAISAGMTAIEFGAALDADTGRVGIEARRRLRKAAGLDREPSIETWAAALVELERRPPRIVVDELRHRRAPCGCWPARDTGVLYEFPPTPQGPAGWPCAHPDGWEPELVVVDQMDGTRVELEVPPPPPGAILCTRGGKGPTAADLEAVQAYSEFLAGRPDPPTDNLSDEPAPEAPVGDAWWS